MHHHRPAAADNRGAHLMRSRLNMICAGIAGMALAGMTMAAQAAVEISAKPTKNMICSAGVCSPTARKAWLNTGDLANMLADSDIKVVTGAGATVIEVTAPLSWASANRLTLDSERSILVKREITVAGPGGVTLTTNDGGTDGVLEFENKGRAIFWDLSSSLVINGDAYTLISSISMLASAIAANPNGRFALSKNYNATPDGTYAQSPVNSTLGGEFEGLGNAIQNVTISSKQKRLGFFSQVGTHGVVRNLLLIGSHLIARTSSGRILAGGLVGLNKGRLEDLRVLDIVMEGQPSENTEVALGGLVGLNQGTVENIRISGTFSVDGYGGVGGLAAGNSGLITSSVSDVTINAGHDSLVGGLSGWNDGTISDSSSAGSVQTGDNGYVGGLVALSIGSIANCHSSSRVTGPSAGWIGFAGGLAGENSGLISRSYATGPVSITVHQGAAGGLVGYIGGGAVQESFATGAVSSGDMTTVGGLVGEDNSSSSGPGSISDSYEMGVAASGKNSSVGGLVGRVSAFDGYSARVSRSYSIGQPIGDGSIGGSVGQYLVTDGSIGSVVWDIDTSGIEDPSEGCGNVANCLGIAGSTDITLKSQLPEGFDPAIWGQNATINNGYPYLLANPPPG